MRAKDKIYLDILDCELTFALLGPSTDSDRRGPDAFLVEMVKTQASPHFPADKPGP